MSIYPYLKKTNTHFLESFPISLGAKLSLPYRYKEISEQDKNYEETLDGYKNFIDSVASKDLSNLETKFEHNLLKKIKAGLDHLDSLNLKLFVFGSLHNTKIYYCQKEIFSGSILPYRNLFLPDEEYQIYASRFIRGDFRNVSVSVTNVLPVHFKFHELEKFNFEEANKNPPENASDIILDFHQITNIMKIEAVNQEFVLNTNYKLIVVDENRNVISGNDNDLFEAHSGIMEKFRFFGFNYKLFTNRLKKAESLYEKALNGYLNKVRTIDIDGSMKRNPPLPKHLLN